VDGSADSKEATRLARDLALSSEAQVIVVHAFEPVTEFLGEPQRSRMSAEHTSEGGRIAEQAVEVLAEAGVDVLVEVLEGPPAPAILSVADVREPDLIVMGSRGHGDLTSLLLGSVSHRVLAHAHAPVMIAKASKADEA
jgi:nucleotide-binding universal stress UspA family protein